MFCEGSDCKLFAQRNSFSHSGTCRRKGTFHPDKGCAQEVRSASGQELQQSFLSTIFQVQQSCLLHGLDDDGDDIRECNDAHFHTVEDKNDDDPYSYFC